VRTENKRSRVKSERGEIAILKYIKLELYIHTSVYLLM